MFGRRLLCVVKRILLRLGSLCLGLRGNERPARRVSRLGLSGKIRHGRGRRMRSSHLNSRLWGKAIWLVTYDTRIEGGNAYRMPPNKGRCDVGAMMTLGCFCLDESIDNGLRVIDRLASSERGGRWGMAS